MDVFARRDEYAMACERAELVAECAHLRTENERLTAEVERLEADKVKLWNALADADLIDWDEEPPCDCCERLEGQWVQYCYCQNNGDLARAQAWCTERNLTEKNSG